jgi:hypothetical protein
MMVSRCTEDISGMQCSTTSSCYAKLRRRAVPAACLADPVFRVRGGSSNVAPVSGLLIVIKMSPIEFTVCAAPNVFAFCKELVIQMDSKSLTSGQGRQPAPLIDDSRPHCMKKEEFHESEYSQRHLR